LADLEKITKKRLGELLVAEGMISQDQLTEALKVQEKSGELLGEALVKAGFTTETEIAKTLCTQFAKPFMRPSKYDIAKDVISLVPPKLMAEHQFVPVDRFGNLLVIAMAGLLDGATFAQLQKLTGCEIELYIATSSDVKLTLRKAFPDLYDPITMLPKFDMTGAVTGGNILPPSVSARDGDTKPSTAPLLPTDTAKATPKKADQGKTDARGRLLVPPPDRTEKTSLPSIDEVGITTSEMRGMTAEEEDDWEALFEEAEQNVLKNLKDAEEEDEDPRPAKKKKP
jgi:hypothetical protein